MKLQIRAAILSTTLAFASAKRSSSGGATYAPVTTVTLSGSAPTGTNAPPPVPTQTTPAVFADSASYQLNSSFEITDTPVTRTFDWTIT
jgi:hypothetical protein